MGRGVAAALAMLMLSAVLAVAPAQAAGSNVTVNPTEHGDLMQTPGSGFQDFVGELPSAFNLETCQLEGPAGTGPDNAGLEGGTIYVRLMWHELEPAEGQYNWPQMDGIFDCARQQNKTVDFRIMLSYPAAGPTNCLPDEDGSITHGIPCWLVRKGVSELFYSGSQPDAIVQDTYLPDWEDPVIRQHHARFIRAFANRYASNPRLNSVDIGSAGLWGEWHTYPDDSLMPSDQRAKEIIDLYASAFPNTPLVVLAEVFKTDLGGDSEVANHLRNNYPGRFGWRGDSWGGFGHHNQDYSPINAANPDIWKTGPVAMEVTGIMSEWPARQDGSGSYDSVLPLDQTIDAALDWHTTLAHNKASGIPGPFVNQLRTMASQAGPRLVLTQLTYNNEASAGSSMSVSTAWHNRGIAPLYRDFRITFRFRNSSGAERIVTTSQTMEGLLPTGNSPTTRNVNVPIPASMATGSWTLDIGVAFHSDSSLRIPIAITSPNNNDWYRMGSVNIVSGTNTGEDGQLVTVAGNNAGWILLDGAKQWLNPDCRTTLEGAGDSFATVAWNTFGSLPQINPKLTCEQAAAAVGSNPGSGEGELVGNSGAATGWFLIDGTRQWLNDTCRSSLEAAGNSFSEQRWSVFGSLPVASPKRTCGEITTLLSGSVSTDRLVTNSTNNRAGWMLTGTTRQWLSEDCRNQLEAAGLTFEVTPYRTFGSLPAAAPLLSCSDIASRFGSGPGPDVVNASVLIDMHNDFLLGQNHVWSPLNGNMGSLDPADELVQTFRFTQNVASGSRTAQFAAVSGSTELDVGELITYMGPTGTMLVTRVESVSGSTATFSPALRGAHANGVQFWSVYGDGAHPNEQGYAALADFALGEFTTGQVNSMRGKSHLFLGDSWMEPGTSTSRLGDQLAARLGGSTTTTNRAVGGRTAADILAALPTDFPAVADVDYVWLIVGTNDYFQQVPTGQFVNNVDRIVNYIESQGAVAIIINPSVGLLDGTRTPIDALRLLSQDYVQAQQAWFEAR